MDNPANSPLIEQVKRLRAAQARMEGEELRRLVQSYRYVHEVAQARADALAQELAKLDKPPTQAQLNRMKRYKELVAETERELERYQAFMRTELRTAARAAIEAGEADARTLVSASIGDARVAAQLRALNPAVIEQLTGFLDPSGPLYKRLEGLGGWTMENMTKAIIEGVGIGQNPRTIARTITDTLGMGLTESTRMMRTVQLWSYREANRASYEENSDVVSKWVWYAELDDVTCPVCISMHGSVHDISENLDGHHNCRCSMVPLVIGAKSDVATGEEWFKGLSEAQQKAALGKGKFEAWKDGKIQLSDLVGSHEDGVYGKMKAEIPLKDLVGEE